MFSGRLQKHLLKERWKFFENKIIVTLVTQGLPSSFLSFLFRTLSIISIYVYSISLSKLMVRTKPCTLNVFFFSQWPKAHSTQPVLAFLLLFPVLTRVTLAFWPISSESSISYMCVHFSLESGFLSINRHVCKQICPVWLQGRKDCFSCRSLSLPMNNLSWRSWFWLLTFSKDFPAPAVENSTPTNAVVAAPHEENLFLVSLVCFHHVYLCPLFPLVIFLMLVSSLSVEADFKLCCLEVSCAVGETLNFISLPWLVTFQ